MTGDNSTMSSTHEKTTEKRQKCRKISSTAARWVQRNSAKAASTAVRLYRQTLPKISSAASTVCQEKLPRVSLKLTRAYQDNAPKIANGVTQAYHDPYSKVITPLMRFSHDASITTIQWILRDTANALLALLRVFQWAASLAIFITVTLKLHRMFWRPDGVHALLFVMIITLVYALLVIVCGLALQVFKKLRVSCWHKFAIATIPGDAVMLCLFIAQQVILNVRALDCAIKTSESDFWTNQNSYAYHGGPDFHPWSRVKFMCAFSHTAQLFSILLILSYLLTIVVTTFQLLQYRERTSSVDSGSHPGHVEEGIPVHRPKTPEMIQQRPTSPESFISRVELVPAPIIRPASCGAPLPARILLEDQEPKYANMPVGIVASMVIAPPRTSVESTSTFDAEGYIVSDGFRSPGEPPGYSSGSSSRSSSLPPGYTSRPTSIFAVVP